MYTVKKIYKDDLFFLNICSIDFEWIHWKEQNIFSGGKATAHKPAQWTEVVLERVSLMATSYFTAAIHEKHSVHLTRPLKVFLFTPMIVRHYNIQ